MTSSEGDGQPVEPSPEPPRRGLRWARILPPALLFLALVVVFGVMTQYKHQPLDLQRLFAFVLLAFIFSLSPGYWRRHLPLLLLLFLGPATGEMLCGSTPPAQFFTLGSALVLVALYGMGAVLVREYALLWGGGMFRLLLLGAAFGIVNEGFACKSFFNPAWPDLDKLGVYGRWVGVNWVWSLNLTLYHMLFSIALPILLVELIFPAKRATTWTSWPTRVVFLALLTADTVVCSTHLAPYQAPVQLACAGMVLVGLILLARFWKGPRQVPAPKRVRRPAFFLLLGLLGVALFFVTQYILPQTPVPAAADFAIAALGAYLLIRLANYSSGGGRSWGDLHRLALAFGGLAFWIFLVDPLLSSGRLPPNGKNYTGQFLVGLAYLLLVLWLRRRILRRGAATEVQPT